MSNTDWLFISSVVLFTLTAAVLDLRTRKLPNWLTVPALVLALLFHGVTGGWLALATSLGGFATGFGLLLILWLIGGGGGGDVKLMGALGAWLGAKWILCVFLLSTLLAVVGSMVMVGILVGKNGYTQVRRRHLTPAPLGGSRRTDSRASEEFAKQRTKRRMLPYALPVALGTWLVLAWQAVLGY